MGYNLLKSKLTADQRKRLATFTRKQHPNYMIGDYINARDIAPQANSYVELEGRTRLENQELCLLVVIHNTSILLEQVEVMRAFFQADIQLTSVHRWAKPIKGGSSSTPNHHSCCAIDYVVLPRWKDNYTYTLEQVWAGTCYLIKHGLIQPGANSIYSGRNVCAAGMLSGTSAGGRGHYDWRNGLKPGLLKFRKQGTFEIKDLAGVPMPPYVSTRKEFLGDGFQYDDARRARGSKIAGPGYRSIKGSKGINRGKRSFFQVLNQNGEVRAVGGQYRYSMSGPIAGDYTYNDPITLTHLFEEEEGKDWWGKEAEPDTRGTGKAYVGPDPLRSEVYEESFKALAEEIKAHLGIEN